MDSVTGFTWIYLQDLRGFIYRTYVHLFAGLTMIYFHYLYGYILWVYMDLIAGLTWIYSQDLREFHRWIYMSYSHCSYGFIHRIYTFSEDLRKSIHLIYLVLFQGCTCIYSHEFHAFIHRIYMY